ncbi:MAG: helix-turn-helix domain-containing protein [Isosphaeraceae bacterium]
MTVKQAAERLEVSQATVYALVAAGKLRCVRVGLGRGTIGIMEEHIAEYLLKAEPVVRQAPASASGRQIKLKHLNRA